LDATEVMTNEQLQRAMREVDPRARLVPSRVLRRIVAREQKVGVLGLHRVHRRSLTIEPRLALHTVSAAELGLAAAESLPDYLLLVEEPEEEMPRDEALGWVWRRLFHARVHAAIDAKCAAGKLNHDEVAGRIATIGRREFAEVRSVLDRDAWLMAPRDDRAVYGEFAAVFLELRYFAESLAPVYFPGIDDAAEVAAVIGRDVDGQHLFEATRPANAPDPAPHPIADDRPEIPPPLDDTGERSERRFRALVALADRSRSMGNVVRSAILRTKAARLVGRSLAGQARSGAADDMVALSRRLASALGVDSIRSAAFCSALGALVARTDVGIWSVEARLLYDLQSVCIDQEREVFQLDLKGWLLSGGRRPLKRPLPNQKCIRMSKHLRSAAGRLANAGIDEESRATLTRSLQDAAHATESKVRERFGPLIARALERAGLIAANLPERISFNRMTDELLDRVVEKNYLTMGEVRDAIARSDLRQPDLSGPRELWRGDRVLRANRRLAVSLDGVYHPGEIYLRALQRASLLMFGTRVGRWLVRFVALPYGGAAGALLTVQELLGFARVHVEMTNLWTVGVLGTLILLMLHSPTFFSLAKVVGAESWRGVRLVFFDAPAWVLARPAVRTLLASRFFDVSRRLLLQPAACAALTYAIAYRLDHDLRVSSGLAVLAFTLTATFLGTRFGREMEDVATDAALLGWRRLSVDLLPGLARFILDLFARVLEAVDRVIYAVDEKLRFRSGEGRGSLYAKAVLGAVWGLLTYILRIIINLFVEPTVNPIKHFPTVTVAAKMLVPYLIPLSHAIAFRLKFLWSWVGKTIAWSALGFLPGLAGFIVWELKENWKLFEANRPRNLVPVMIGHHGETMRRLVLPGFHSGTIPKLFTKLRHTERQAYRTGRHEAARKAREAIEHVEAPIRHFIERGFQAILIESGRFVAGEIALDRVRMATNRVELLIVAADADDRKLRITFEDEDGRLIARVCDGGLRAGLSDEQREALDAATTGMSARAGAEGLLGDASVDGCFASRAPAELPRVVPSQGGEIEIPWSRWVDYWSPPTPEAENLRIREVADELTK
jgi:hypothetical protein